MKKVLILVLTFDDGGGYSEMDKIVRETWGNQNYPSVKIFYNYAKYLGDKKFEVDGDRIYCDGYESYATIGEKTIKALSFLINEDFDYLLRANSSSFIHIPNLLKFLDDKPSTEFYSGKVLPYHTHRMSIDFVSGSSYILSNDLVKYIVENPNVWDHSYPDDVAIGKIMYEKNVEISPSEWIKLDSVPTHDVLNEIGEKFQIRCKIETRYDHDTQIEIFKFLNTLIYKS